MQTTRIRAFLCVCVVTCYVTTSRHRTASEFEKPDARRLHVPYSPIQIVTSSLSRTTQAQVPIGTVLPWNGFCMPDPYVNSVRYTCIPKCSQRFTRPTGTGWRGPDNQQESAHARASSKLKYTQSQAPLYARCQYTAFITFVCCHYCMYCATLGSANSSSSRVCSRYTAGIHLNNCYARTSRIVLPYAGRTHDDHSFVKKHTGVMVECCVELPTIHTNSTHTCYMPEIRVSLITIIIRRTLVH